MLTKHRAPPRVCAGSPGAIVRFIEDWCHPLGGTPPSAIGSSSRSKRPTLTRRESPVAYRLRKRGNSKVNQPQPLSSGLVVARVSCGGGERHSHGSGGLESSFS